MPSKRKWPLIRVVAIGLMLGLFWLPLLAWLVAFALSRRLTETLTAWLLMALVPWIAVGLSHRPRRRRNAALIWLALHDAEGDRAARDAGAGSGERGRRLVSEFLSRLTELDLSGWRWLVDAAVRRGQLNPIAWLMPGYLAERRARRALWAVWQSGGRRDAVQNATAELRVAAQRLPNNPVGAAYALLYPEFDRRLPSLDAQQAVQTITLLEEVCAALVYEDELTPEYLNAICSPFAMIGAATG